MKKNMRKVIITLMVMLLILPYMFVEVQTLMYKSEFEEEYKQTNMISGIEYLKVFYCAKNRAKVYYVEKDRATGSFVYFNKVDEKWIMDSWDTVWSKKGSADGMTYPFYR